MQHNYDLNLPAWGPYNKEFLGCAHVTDKSAGLRFDINLFPGYYRRSVMSVRDVADGGAKMMEASPDLSHFVYRYELEWKDRVYADAKFNSDGDTVTVRCRFCNETDIPESLALDVLASLHPCSNAHNEIIDMKTKLPLGCTCIGATDYDDISCRGSVANDGLRFGEGRGSGFTGGVFLRGKDFFSPEHKASYSIASGLYDSILVRYRSAAGAKYRLITEKAEQIIILPPQKVPGSVIVPTGAPGAVSFVLVPLEGSADLDCFVTGPAEELTSVSFVPVFDAFIPETEYDEAKGELRLCYGGKYSYGMKIEGAPIFVRSLHTQDPGALLETVIHNHVSRDFGNDNSHAYVDCYVSPLFIEPHGTHEVVITVKALDSAASSADGSTVRFDSAPACPSCNPSGAKYLLSQKITDAVVLTNVVYPIYCGRSYIRHNTPGRVWDCLYTWDSGFCGMGLATMSVQRAVDCLNTYLSPLGLYRSPYTQHGSPLPTQIFLLWELFSRTCDRKLLDSFYDRALQQYSFFAGRKNHRRAHGCGIFNTWDVFYNSGGWDDYPAQKYVHANSLENSVSPVVNTAMTALYAKLMIQLGGILGKDTAALLEDAEFFDRALNTYAWDEESGYYGYTQQKDGASVEIMKINGVNADMGMDGVFPYIADICPENRSARILDNIRTGMMGQYGICVVDSRAPYYRSDGYWNGAIWMPHQWILWKSLLDHCETDFAFRIADTALSLWDTETGRTYNCYEHFMVQNGRGAGFHQFSGLSTPVLMWFEAYYTPFTVTGGFCSLIYEKTRTARSFSFKARVSRPKAAVIVCLPEETEPVFNTEATAVCPGAYSLILPQGENEITIKF